MSDMSSGVQLLERVPVPSLASYTAISVSLLSCAAYYSMEMSSQEEWRSNPNVTEGIAETWLFLGGSKHVVSPPNEATSLKMTPLADRHPLLRFLEIAVFIISDPLCIWALVNMAYCMLGLLGKLIQLLVFGHLRISEEQHLKDKFWNFVFYKFIFIFGVLNVQHMEQVLAWVAWFSLLGFLHLMTTLSKDRFQYLSFSPSVPVGVQVRLVGLLSGVQATCALCFGVCLLCGLRYGIDTFALMLAEVALVSLNAGYVLARYVYVPHAASTGGGGGAAGGMLLEAEGKADKAGASAGGVGACPVYYTELVFELATLAVDFLHHLHMLVWTNTMLSMASLVISMQLRWAFNEIRRRVLKHRNYLRVLRHMIASYPMAAGAELRASADNCAICWELMLSARKLPCGHLFHNACLRSWLEQDTSCPTCRLTLQSSSEAPAPSERRSLFGALMLSSLRVEAEASLRPALFRARDVGQHSGSTSGAANNSSSIPSSSNSSGSSGSSSDRDGNSGTGDSYHGSDGHVAALAGATTPAGSAAPTATAVPVATSPTSTTSTTAAARAVPSDSGTSAAAAAATRASSSTAARAALAETLVTNHLFTFDGSRYFSWLPSVSLEVSHSNIVSQSTPAVPPAPRAVTPSPPLPPPPPPSQSTAASVLPTDAGRTLTNTTSAENSDSRVEENVKRKSADVASKTANEVNEEPKPHQQQSGTTGSFRNRRIAVSRAARTRVTCSAQSGSQKIRRQPLELNVCQSFRHRVSRSSRHHLQIHNQQQQEHQYHGQQQDDHEDQKEQLVLENPKQQQQQRPCRSLLAPTPHVSSAGDVSASGPNSSSGVGTQRGDLEHARPLSFDCNHVRTRLNSSSSSPSPAIASSALSSSSSSLPLPPSSPSLGFSLRSSSSSSAASSSASPSSVTTTTITSTLSPRPPLILATSVDPGQLSPSSDTAVPEHRTGIGSDSSSSGCNMVPWHDTLESLCRLQQRKVDLVETSRRKFLERLEQREKEPEPPQ